MRQFDVFSNPSEQSRGNAPYLVVLQSHYLDALATVVVAPLIRAVLVQPDNTISFPVEVDGESLTVAISMLANIETRRLKARVGDLIQHEDEIRRALGRLFTGF